MIDITKIGNETIPSIIQNPFIQSKIKRIEVKYEMGIFSNEWEASGQIYFKNGETSAYQNFKGETFDEVCLKIKAEINGLTK